MWILYTIMKICRGILAVASAALTLLALASGAPRKRYR